MYKLSKFILKLWGWKTEGHFPPDIPKYIIAIAPHTSNWDFPLGMLVRSATKADVKFVAKHTLFKFPYGFIFRWLKGYPVNRSKSLHFVDNVVKLFDEHEKFAVVISPEGTRTKVEKFKTGFYFIARKAHIPIVLSKFDWEHKVVSFTDPIYTTDNFDKDMDIIMQYFKGVKGKNPEQGML